MANKEGSLRNEQLSNNYALQTAEAVRSGRMVRDFDELTRASQNDVFNLMNQLLRELREQYSPFWSVHSPEGFVHQFRERGVLRPDEIESMALTPAVRRLLRAYRANIDTEGVEAIAHLCLRPPTFEVLTRMHARTLDQARFTLADSDVSHIIWNGGHRYGSFGFEIESKMKELAEERAFTAPHGA